MATLVTGKISQVYPDDKGCYISLAGIASNAVPKSGLFQLKLTHPNYNSLYSLILSAAINHYDITVKAAREITRTSFSEIRYLKVEW